jgi:predicted transcriptional regulator
MMTTITIDVPDELLRKLGENALRERLKRHVELIRLMELGIEIRTALEAQGIDWETEWQASRQAAWDEYLTEQPRLKELLQ